MAARRVAQKISELEAEKRFTSRSCNENCIALHREQMHAPLHAYETRSQALARPLSDAPPPSRWVLPLTPAKWSCRIDASPLLAPEPTPDVGFEGASAWERIDLPCSLECADGVVAKPWYTNTIYPFPLDPPRVPTAHNHAASFQTSFDVPASWRGRRVYLQLDGVESCCTAWIDGRLAGYSQDSRLPCEFEVTEQLSGDNRTHTLSVQVLRWCDGSYLEDQDTWWLSGIHRHVRLLSKPAALAIRDFAVTTDVADGGASAALSVRVSLAGSGGDSHRVRACSTGPTFCRSTRRRRDPARFGSSSSPYSRSPSGRWRRRAGCSCAAPVRSNSRRCCSGRRSGRRSSRGSTRW